MVARGFLFTYHSIAGKQEVGTGSEDMSLNNYSAAASRWEKRGGYIGHFPLLSRE